MAVDLIYQNGEHYDHMWLGGGAEYLQFWVGQARCWDGPILELGSGTGRIAIPLARGGHQVTGLEQAPSMLERARRKAAKAGVEVEWVAGDMRGFALERRFGLIILPHNTLCHLLTLADFEACAASVLRHLKDGGRFIVEVFVPDLAMLLETADRRQLFARYEDPGGGGEIVISYTSRYDAAAQIKHNTTYCQYPGRKDEEAGSLDMRIYFPQELDALFKYSGFEYQRKLGDFDGRPFGAASTKQICILKRAGGR